MHKHAAAYKNRAEERRARIKAKRALLRGAGTAFDLSPAQRKIRKMVVIKRRILEGERAANEIVDVSGAPSVVVRKPGGRRKVFYRRKLSPLFKDGQAIGRDFQRAIELSTNAQAKRSKSVSR